MFFHGTWQSCNYVVYAVLSRVLMRYGLFNYALIPPGGLKYYCDNTPIA